MKLKNIFLIDDDALFIAAFSKKLERIGGFNIHHFSSIEEGIPFLETLNPEIVFLDHYLEGKLGIEAIPELLIIVPKAEIIIVSNQSKVSSIAQAMSNGATDYFQKDTLLVSKSKDFIFEYQNKKSSFASFWSKVFA